MNEKLWHLGNEVVRLRQKIEKTFPEPITLVGVKSENVFGDTFLEILELINQIRLAVRDEEKEERVEKSECCIQFDYFQDLEKASDFLTAFGINHRIRKLAISKNK